MLIHGKVFHTQIRTGVLLSSVPDSQPRSEAQLADGSAVTKSENITYFERTDKLLAAIFNAASLGLAMFDLQTRVVVSNPAFAAMIAHSSTQACVGKRLRELLGDSAEDLEIAFQRICDTGQSEQSIEISTRLSGHGEVGHWLFNLIPVRSKTQNVSQVVAVTVETSHQKRIEAYFLTLMADMSWIQEQICKDPATLLNRREFLRPIGERTDPLGPVSEEVRRVSALLQCTNMMPLKDAERVGPLEPSIQGVSLRQKAEHSDSLSPRELQVLTLVGSGKTNKEIASLTRLSVKTVETYRNRLNIKLQLHSPTELVLYAVRNNLVPRDPTDDKRNSSSNTDLT